MSLLSRRFFLSGSFFAGVSLFHRWLPWRSSSAGGQDGFLRPPGTDDEAHFLATCSRCRLCANVCAAGCIRFFSVHQSGPLAGTPYLNVRDRACNLCMNCTQVCPTGALKPITDTLSAISDDVRMGTAVVQESFCLSFTGRVCGVCRDVCPLKGKAIRLVPPGKPIVDADVCIGCGRCEERCPQFPAAIIVLRKETRHV